MEIIPENIRILFRKKVPTLRRTLLLLVLHMDYLNHYVEASDTFFAYVSENMLRKSVCFHILNKHHILSNNPTSFWRKGTRFQILLTLKVFKNGPSKICGRRSLKNLKWYGLPKQTISLQIFKRLSSANFTWSILEYLDRYKPYDINTVKFVYSGGNTMVLAAASDFLEIKRVMVKVS